MACSTRNTSDELVTLSGIPAAPVQQLHARLGLSTPIENAERSFQKQWAHWSMAEDDAPILRYLYHQVRPRRHLEFGTWRGAGTVDVLESCEAEVWTINLPEGERKADGGWAYCEPVPSRQILSPDTPRFVTRSGQVVAQTDGPGLVGTLHRQHDQAHRVHQILCDSRAWDTVDYPPGFFDTVLIDGGHSEEVVTSDTRKALPLVRSGGLVMWHDFCPDSAVREHCTSVRGVTAAIATLWPWLGGQCRDVFWVQPSWLLIGVRR